MRFERRHAVLLLAVAAWTVLSFGNFALNLYDAWSAGEDRATSYWVAHTVLIVVNLVIAALLGTLGWRAWRATRRPGASGGPGRESARSTYGGGRGAAH